MPEHENKLGIEYPIQDAQNSFTSYSPGQADRILAVSLQITRIFGLANSLYCPSSGRNVDY